MIDSPRIRTARASVMLAVSGRAGADGQNGQGRAQPAVDTGRA